MGKKISQVSKNSDHSVWSGNEWRFATNMSMFRQITSCNDQHAQHVVQVGTCSKNHPPGEKYGDGVKTY